MFDDTMLGSIVELTEDELRKLDRYKGVYNGKYERIIMTDDFLNKSVRPVGDLKPSHDYPYRIAETINEEGWRKNGSKFRQEDFFTK
jgi:hypothetical protein